MCIRDSETRLTAALRELGVHVHPIRGVLHIVALAAELLLVAPGAGVASLALDVQPMSVSPGVALVRLWRLLVAVRAEPALLAVATIAVLDPVAGQFAVVLDGVLRVRLLLEVTRRRQVARFARVGRLDPVVAHVADVHRRWSARHTFAGMHHIEMAVGAIQPAHLHVRAVRDAYVATGGHFPIDAVALETALVGGSLDVRRHLALTEEVGVDLFVGEHLVFQFLQEARVDVTLDAVHVAVGGVLPELDSLAHHVTVAAEARRRRHRHRKVDGREADEAHGRDHQQQVAITDAHGTAGVVVYAEEPRPAHHCPNLSLSRSSAVRRSNVPASWQPLWAQKSASAW